MVTIRRVSGILFPFRGDCHFSRPAVTRRLQRPTLRLGRATLSASEEAIVSIHGLAARMVYLTGMSPPDA